MCNKVARRILKVHLLFFPLPLQKPAGSRSVKGSVSRVYFFSRSLLIFLFRNVFLPLSLFLSPLLRPSFSNSQTSLAYSAKFGQIEQLIKSQYVIINRRDVSVNVGRRKRIVFKRNSRRSRWRDPMRGGHFVENRKRTEKISRRHEVSCAREDRRVYLLEHKNVICL